MCDRDGSFGFRMFCSVARERRRVLCCAVELRQHWEFCVLAGAAALALEMVPPTAAMKVRTHSVGDLAEVITTLLRFFSATVCNRDSRGAGTL